MPLQTIDEESEDSLFFFMSKNEKNAFLWYNRTN